MNIAFFEPMLVPRTTHNRLEIRYKKQGSKRIPYIGKSNVLKAAEAKWAAHLARNVPEIPLDGAVRADVRICWPSSAKHPNGSPVTTTPDLDNVEKVLWDVLVRLGYLKDDCLVFDKHVCKMYNNPAGIYISLEEVRW